MSTRRLAVPLLLAVLTIGASCSSGNDEPQSRTIRFEFTTTGPETVRFFGHLFADPSFDVEGTTPFSRDFPNVKETSVESEFVGGRYQGYRATALPIRSSQEITLCLTALETGERKCDTQRPPRGRGHLEVILLID